MLISSLLYIMLGTRADIAFAMIKLARFASNPSNIHFTAVKRVYKYLKGIINYGITYYKEGSRYISGYYDADYAGCRDFKISKDIIVRFNLKTKNK
jgi:hypothetical protein